MESLTISVTGANGDTITFDGEDYTLSQGVRGFGISATSVRIQESAGDGGIWRHTKRGVREFDLAVTVIGSGHTDVEAKLRRLARLLQDRDGATTVTATYSTGEEYFIQAHYVSGAETVFGESAGSTFCNWLLTMQAPQPYWTSTTPQSVSVIASAGTRGLLATTPLTKLRVKTSQALGSIVVSNNGDVQTPIVWQITGAATAVTISCQGQGFTYTETITSSDTITIDTEANTVVNQSGVNKYSKLSTAPKLFYVPSGESIISITATGADSNTKIQGFYQPRYEVIH